MKGWGSFLIIAGIICAFCAITMDTSVETGVGSRVNNFGLMNTKNNLVIYSGIAFIAGIILIGLSTKASSTSITENNKNTRCQYCAEIIKREAKICRFCGKDSPVLDDINLNHKGGCINKEKEGSEQWHRENKIIIHLQKELNRDPTEKEIKKAKWDGLEL